MKKRFIFIVAFVFTVSQVAYSNVEDSLINRIKQSRDTLEKIQWFCELSNFTGNLPGNKSQNYAEEAHKLALSYSDTCILCQSYFALATAHQGKTQYTKALDYYQKAYQLSIKCNNQKILQRSCNNLGMLNRLSENTEKAMEWYYKSLEIGRNNHDTLGMIFTLNNIGNIYNDNKEHEKAIKKYEESVELIQASGNKYSVYLSRILYNIAETHYNLGNNTQAIKIYKQTYEMIGDKSPYESAVLLKSIAEIFIDGQNYKAALLYLDKAGEYYHKIDRKSSEQEYYFLRYQVELKLNMHEAALKDLEKYQQLQDSIDIKNMHVLITDIQEKYDNEKLRNINELQERNLKNRNRTIFAGGIILLLTILLLIFTLNINRYRKKVNQKLREKQKQIDDGLEYGRYVKEKLMLSNDNLLNNNGFNHFIIDKPKDKVGGDFSLIKKHNSGIFIIVGDATGHGIPGAFISLSALNIFHQILETESSLNPNELIEKAISKWKNQSNAQNDYDESFTCSVLCLNDEYCTLSSYKQKSILLNKHNEIEIPDKLNKSERKISKITPNINIPYQNNEWIILTSDGYYDQLGNNNERLKLENMSSIIQSINKKDNVSLSNTLNETLNQHKGDNKQTDDILVIGIGLTRTY